MGVHASRFVMQAVKESQQNPETKELELDASDTKSRTCEFNDTHTVVPELPKDELMVLQPTTFCLAQKSTKPWRIGNTFIEFLNSAEIDATLLKVRPWKFSVSANAFLEGKMVRVKARIYKDDEVYLFQLHQNTGCPVIFNKVYRKVLSWFDRRYEILPKSGPESTMAEGESVAPFSLSTAPPPRLKEGLEFPTPVAVDVSPLVDMMMMKVASLQTEMFNSLAGLSDKNALGTDEFAKNVTKLLQMESFPTDAEAEYAFGDMLVQAASSVEVSQRLAKHRGWLYAVDRILDDKISLVARKKLRKACDEGWQKLQESSFTDKDQIMEELERCRAPLCQA